MQRGVAESLAGVSEWWSRLERVL